MKELTATPLANYSHEWKVLPQQIVSDPSDETFQQSACGHGQDPGSRFSFQGFRNRN